MREAYAGIGSRKTPLDVQQRMVEFASAQMKKGMTLYSGGADGADKAFESGAGDKKIIFIPWDGFNGYRHDGIRFIDPKKDCKPLYYEAKEIAAMHHPSWASMSDGAKKMHTRNVYQVMGRDLKTPVKFVACWVPVEHPIGGTGQAIRIAKSKEIPVYYF